MLLMIDNYDSFTYNLVHYFKELKQEIQVVRNDEYSLEELNKKDISKLIISPGPCTPLQAGISMQSARFFAEKNIPVLGVCLGMQSIVQEFGGDIVQAPYLMHGKTSDIYHNDSILFKNIPSPYKSTRYHSLIAQEKSLPSCLEVTARTDDKLIMAIEHKSLPLYGVQFHPESILSEYGHRLLKNFLTSE